MAAEDGLKAQKLLAQGIALGNVCKKQSRPERAKALKLKAFALSGRQVYIHKYPGRCPGLGASALSVAPDMPFPPLGVPADLQSAVKK